jgi:response regulator of citrate/malate metabolism
MHHPHNKLIVCLIDDDRIYQFTAQKTIEATQLVSKVISFQHGKEAMHFLTANNANTESLPDIIFLDINMPEMDGWGFLDAFKGIKGQLSKSIVIYMVSSSVDEYDLRRSSEYEEVKNYLIKPVIKERFAEVLASFTTLT